MGQVRDRGAILENQEIEAIKVNQEIIKRMADNSQKIKNVFLATSALAATLAGSGSFPPTRVFLYVFVAIAVVFWIMDAKYLQLERGFRKHHAAIVNGSINYLDQWDFNPKRDGLDCLIKVMFSFSLLIYPAAIVVLWVLATL